MQHVSMKINTKITSIYIPIFSLIIALSSVVANIFISKYSFDNTIKMSVMNENNQRLRDNFRDRHKLISELYATFTLVSKKASSSDDAYVLYNAIMSSFTEIIIKARELKIIGNSAERKVSDNILQICVDSSRELGNIDMTEKGITTASEKILCITMKAYLHFGKLSEDLCDAATVDYDSYLKGVQQD